MLLFRKKANSRTICTQVSQPASPAVLPLLLFFTRSGFFIENRFFDSGQILEMCVVLLYFLFKNTLVSQGQCAELVDSSAE